MTWLGRLFGRARLERELERELADHIERRAAELVAGGAEASEAARRARLEFGGADQIKEECRDARGTRWAEDFLRDCRYGWRILRRSPAFTGVALLSLGLGIGAATAIFSLMDRVMFRMLPVREPQRLVEITRFHPPYGPANMSYPLFRSLGGQLTGFEGLLARHGLGAREIAIGGMEETATFELVSGSYYPLLGVEAAVGRTFGEETDRAPGASPVAVISHRYWERRFAADPAAIGTKFRRMDTVFTIIGVTPRAFFGTVVGEEPDITVPITMDAQVRGGPSWLNEPGYGWLSVMGRLSPGMGARRAQAEAARVFAGIMASDTTSTGWDWDRAARSGEYVELEPGGNGFDHLRSRFSSPLAVLMGAAALVLLLACANLANLLLARLAGRQREIAVRLALGAGRARVTRQLAAEGLLLAAGGGALGVLLAYVFASALLRMMTNGGPAIRLDAAPDARVLAFALAVSLAACMLFSAAPAVQAMRQSLQPWLAEIRAGRWRLGRGLIVAQMAISVLLLIGAGLFGRSIVNMYRLDPGFDRRGVVLFSTNAARLGYTRARVERLEAELPAQLEEHTAIRSATVSMFPPISGGGWDGVFLVEGHAAAPGAQDVTHINSVGIDFFKTFGTPVVSGRDFDRRDTANSPRVAIVNESFARHYFADQSPLGKWVAFPGPEKDTHYEIVGMVKDVKYESLRAAFPPTVYMMASQVPPGPDSYMFAVRSAAGMAAAVASIEATLAGIDKGLRPTSLMSLEDHVAQSLLRERMLAALAGFFGAQALLLAVVGIYGVMAFQVARRRREIGIRMALGAGAGSVIGMVLGETARLTLVGSAAGVAGGLVLARATEGLLFGIGASDPVTYGLAFAVLLVTALGAAYLPGRSAARTDPAATLRMD